MNSRSLRDDSLASSYLLLITGFTNTLLSVEVDAASNSADVSLQCHFVRVVTGTASCLVRYGSDPSCQDLPLQNEMSQNLTNGGTITVPLPSVQSVGSAPVYYVVVAQTDSQSVSIVGFFRRGEYNYVIHSRTPEEVGS